MTETKRRPEAGILGAPDAVSSGNNVRLTTAGDRDETPSALTSNDFGVPLGTWNDHIRRARIIQPRKLVALTLSSYADDQGRSVRCGVARLAMDCDMGYSTARRHLAWLRTAGLVELVRPGNHKAKRADEYRLTICAHSAEYLNAPDPDEYRARIADANAANSAGEKKRRTSDLRSPKESAVTTESQSPSALNLVSAEDGHLRSPETASALTQEEPPPSSNHLPEEEHLPTGGTLPPDPLRPPTPTASGPGNVQPKSLSEPLTPAQDQEGESLPHTRAMPAGLSRAAQDAIREAAARRAKALNAHRTGSAA